MMRREGRGMKRRGKGQSEKNGGAKVAHDALVGSFLSRRRRIIIWPTAQPCVSLYQHGEIIR